MIHKHNLKHQTIFHAINKKEIQEIITYEVIVDCYDDDEEANIGWAIFLSENIYYPFEAEYEVKKKRWFKILEEGNRNGERNG